MKSPFNSPWALLGIGLSFCMSTAWGLGEELIDVESKKGGGVISPGKSNLEGPDLAAPVNVLLLCVDDLRPVMGSFGGLAKTPQMDGFAEQATAFTRHYVQWPVCGPSRASMLGGVRPDSTGIYEIGNSWTISQAPEVRPTLPLIFKTNGYTTLSFGKVYHSKGIGRGFGWCEDPWHPESGWTCYVDFTYIEGKGSKNKWRPAYEIYDGPDSLHNDYRTADKVITALRENKDRPFLVAGGFYKPHLPFVAPKKYWDLYSKDEIGKIDPVSLPKGAADYMYNWSEISTYGDQDGQLFSGDKGVTDEEWLNLIHAYYASVSFIDAQIGRILDELEELGLSDTTAVVIWGDHGFHLGDHGRWAKHTQFEQAMRSPLLIRLPGHQNLFGPTNALAESVDIYPTLCDFAGIEIPDFVEGESLLPVIEGLSSGKEAAFSQIRPVGGPKAFRPMAYSVRTANFRYVEWRDPESVNRAIWRELYDHRKDPQESVSVSDNPEYADAMKRHAELVSENYRSLK